MPDLVGLVMLGLLYGATVCSLSCLPTLGPLLVGEGGGFRKGISGGLSFMCGKVVVYTLIGGVAAAVGHQLPLDNGKLKILPGVILVAAAIYLFFRKPASCPSSCAVSGSGVRRPLSFMALGAATGLTPCVPLMTVMLMAAKQGDIFLGAACGLFFGVGLLVSPMILAGGGLAFLSRRIKWEVGPWVQRLAAVILLGNSMHYFN